MDEPTDIDENTTTVPPEEAFGRLANQTRVNILQTLWERDKPLEFSALQDRADVDDSGNFNYHLDQLVETFVRRTDAGYELMAAGEHVVRAILQGSLTDEISIPPTELDIECNRCGSTLEIRYNREKVLVRCQNCQGVVGGPDIPSGTFMYAPLPSSALLNRTPEEILEVAHAYYMAKLTPMLDGVCPECAGIVEPHLELCHDHETEGVCAHCGWLHPAFVHYVCSHCAYTRGVMIWIPLVRLPAVVNFYHETGVIESETPFQSSMWEVAGFVDLIDVDILERDPPRIAVTYPSLGASLEVVVDDELTVLERHESGT